MSMSMSLTISYTIFYIYIANFYLTLFENIFWEHLQFSFLLSYRGCLILYFLHILCIIDSIDSFHIFTVGCTWWILESFFIPFYFYIFRKYFWEHLQFSFLLSYRDYRFFTFRIFFGFLFWFKYSRHHWLHIIPFLDLYLTGIIISNSFIFRIVLLYSNLFFQTFFIPFYFHIFRKHFWEHLQKPFLYPTGVLWIFTFRIFFEYLFQSILFHIYLLDNGLWILEPFFFVFLFLHFP